MELLRALAVLAEPPGPETQRVAAVLGVPAPSAADHTDVLGFQLYPYASVYLGEQGMLGGEARDRVAGFLRALGATPPPEPDHVAVLLSVLAETVERERGAADADAAAAWRRARTALLFEHLLSWAPAWLDRVVVLGGVYAPWAELVRDVLADQASAVGAPAELPLALREAPGLEDPRGDENPKRFLGQLLAPVRTGVILTRSDLDRAARDLALGSRVGERRFVLTALLSQAPDAVLGWLAEEADRRAAAQRLQADWAAPCAPFWADRAEATAALLGALGRDAADALAAATA